jgi:hypothetical protein
MLFSHGNFLVHEFSWKTPKSRSLSTFPDNFRTHGFSWKTPKSRKLNFGFSWGSPVTGSFLRILTARNLPSQKYFCCAWLYVESSWKIGNSGGWIFWIRRWSFGKSVFILKTVSSFGIRRHHGSLYPWRFKFGKSRNWYSFVTFGCEQILWKFSK